MRFRVGASAPPPFQKCVFIGILVGGEDLNLRPHGPKFNQQRGKRISPELQADSPHQFVTVYARKRVNSRKHLRGIISTNSGTAIRGTNSGGDPQRFSVASASGHTKSSAPAPNAQVSDRGET
jgi:hypothetical protein